MAAKVWLYDLRSKTSLCLLQKIEPADCFYFPVLLHFHFRKTQEHLLWIFIKYRAQKRAVIQLTAISGLSTFTGWN
ncbi:MAG: hypothetical protein V9F01_17870 [Chitinophagaceae bacterium]